MCYYRRFKTRDAPSTILKGAPDFCTVYVISKGKISATKAASRLPPFISPLHTHIPPEPSTAPAKVSTDKILPIKGFSFVLLAIFHLHLI